MKRGPIEKVRAKGIEIPIYLSPVRGKRNYVIAYYLAGKRHRDRAGTTLQAARRFAKRKIEELSREPLTHKEFMASLDEAQDLLWETAKQLKKEQKKTPLPIKLPELARKFMADLRERQKSRRYMIDMRSKLARAAEAFPGPIAEISTADIDDWLRGMKTSGRTKNNYRKSIATLLSFARTKGFLPRGQKTEAEFSTRFDDKGSAIGVYSAAELAILLNNVERRFVPFVSIAAFAGLRSAEIVRLDWADIRCEHGDIQLARHQAKTASRRLAPLLPCLRLWLEPFRKESGPVLEGIRDEFDLGKRFRKAVNAIMDADGKPLVRTVHNGLRHSFISYRMAILRSAPATALESGNSPAIIFRHYRELVTEAEARAWFSIVPEKPI